MHEEVKWTGLGVRVCARAVVCRNERQAAAAGP